RRLLQATRVSRFRAKHRRSGAEPRNRSEVRSFPFPLFPGANMRKCLWLVVLVLFCVAGSAQPYDILIRSGRMIDGTGNPWMYADVGITGERISFVGRAPVNAPAKRVIDAKGLIVAPGFIDMLEQSEWNLLIDKQAVSKLTQGITTGITGEGGSIAPQ